MTANQKRLVDDAETLLKIASAFHARRALGRLDEILDTLEDERNELDMDRFVRYRAVAEARKSL